VESDPGSGGYDLTMRHADSVGHWYEVICLLIADDEHSINQGEHCSPVF